MTTNNEYPVSVAQAIMDVQYVQAEVAGILGKTVADALFAPVVAAVISDEDAMIEAMAEARGYNDMAVVNGYIYVSSGFGTD